MLFSLLIFFITSTVILASPTTSGLGDVNDSTLSCASDDSLLPTDENSITGEIVISKRRKDVSECKPINSGVGTGTETPGQSTENNEKSTTLDDNPCDVAHPHYHSCGGPELIYKSGRLYAVMNCMKAIKTVIEKRGFFGRDDKLNEYCCENFIDEDPDWPGETCLRQFHPWKFQQFTTQQWLEILRVHFGDKSPT